MVAHGVEFRALRQQAFAWLEKFNRLCSVVVVRVGALRGRMLPCTILTERG